MFRKIPIWRLPAFFSAEDSAAAWQEVSSSREQKPSLGVLNNAGKPSRFKRRLDPRFYTNLKDAIAPAERDTSPSQRTAAIPAMENASMTFLNSFKSAKTLPRIDRKIAWRTSLSFQPSGREHELPARFICLGCHGSHFDHRSNLFPAIALTHANFNRSTPYLR